MKSIEIVLQPEEAASNEIIIKRLKKLVGLGATDKIYFSIQRRSIDARGRSVKIRLLINYTVNELLPEPPSEERKLKQVHDSRPVAIIGCGPAGLFAALRLIELGLNPVIIERGKNVRDRRRDLAIINKQGIVNSDSNYCFGEGGAGTYSDGKLYTRSNKRGSIQRILNTFIQFGASPDIAVDAHPHIGTNKLPAIIEKMREAILSCGGEIIFNTRFEGFNTVSGKIQGIYISSVLNPSQSVSHISVEACLLATGHSAHNVFEYFEQQKLLIESKPFALGVRVEHPQQIIDAAQYHCKVRSEFLPPSSYSLVNQSFGKGVYSFCMCPGGIIAPAATAPGEIVVNGWSPSRRNNPFANSGMVVSVEASDYKQFGNSPLAALKYQRKVEADSFIAGGGKLKAPAQRLVDFVTNTHSDTLPSCSYIPGLNSVQLHEVLPAEICKPLQESFKVFGKKLKGYYTNEAVLVATESRTSSPVRIPRDAHTLMHPQVMGLFPCGEGAGYAGGIVSAAMDGEKCAEAIGQFLKV